MKDQIIKDLMEAIHDVAKIKGENESLKKEIEYFRGLLTKQLNILPVISSFCHHNGTYTTTKDDDGNEICCKCRKPLAK